MQLIDGQPVFSATDLVGFLACEHLTGARAGRASRASSSGRSEPTRSWTSSRSAASQHEQRYLADLEAAGRTRHANRAATTPSRIGASGCAAPPPRPEAAIRRGDDVIYQATFFDGRWLGYADFLLRVETPSALGPVELRDRGHQARPPHQGERAAPDLLVRRTSSTRIQGLRARVDARRPRRERANGRAPSRRRLHGLLPRSPGAASRSRSPATTPGLSAGRDVSRARRALRRLPLGRGLHGAPAQATTTSRSSPGSRRASGKR